MGIEKSKIAVLCNYELLPERVGGMDAFFWEFDKKCKEANIEVDWFFPNGATHGDYQLLTIKYNSSKSIESFFLESLAQQETDYTHIITHFLELCTPFFKQVKQLSKATIIAVDHNPRPLEGYPVAKRIKKRIKGLLFSRYIDLFVGVSAYTIKELLKDFGKHIQPKTQVIYNGIDILEIATRTTRSIEKPTFLTASHLRFSKGIQDLIQAVALLPEPIKKELKIDVFGDGPYKMELQALVQVLKLEHCFNFKGSTAQLKSLYANYDYMLQPTHMECFSLSILESLAANVPVITTNVGGNEEAITNNENGYIFEAKNIDQLSDLLQEVYMGNKKITANTRKLIEERFTIDKMVSEYMQIVI
ncbi:MAG: glycosyltransferase family 4 protein [Lutibacter sp.]|nr:glycosyltransferase family 4 protein [Lutibacter sp.]MDP3945597.1 glycosyltransferase family 4 protein [Lutibacter sp.]